VDSFHFRVSGSWQVPFCIWQACLVQSACFENYLHLLAAWRVRCPAGMRFTQLAGLPPSLGCLDEIWEAFAHHLADSFSAFCFRFGVRLPQLGERGGGVVSVGFDASIIFLAHAMILRIMGEKKACIAATAQCVP